MLLNSMVNTSPGSMSENKLEIVVAPPKDPLAASSAILKWNNDEVARVYFFNHPEYLHIINGSIEKVSNVFFDRFGQAATSELVLGLLVKTKLIKLKLDQNKFNESLFYSLPGSIISIYLPRNPWSGRRKLV